METPLDNNVSLEEPQVEAYPDNNSNEKSVPASQEIVYESIQDTVAVEEPQIAEQSEINNPTTYLASNSEESNIVSTETTTETFATLNAATGDFENVQPELVAAPTEMQVQVQEDAPDANVGEPQPPENETMNEHVENLNGVTTEEIPLETTTENVFVANETEPLQTVPTDACLTEIISEENHQVEYVFEEGSESSQENQSFSSTTQEIAVYETEYVENNPIDEQQHVLEGISDEITAQNEQPMVVEELPVNTDAQDDSVRDDDVTTTSQEAEMPTNDERPTAIEETKNETANESEKETENAHIEPKNDVAKTNLKNIIQAATENTPEVSEYDFVEHSEEAYIENADGTVVYIQTYDDISETSSVTMDDAAIQERSGAISRASAASSDCGPKRRGRRSTNDIPLHVLGHDINKPVENGKAPKPRLGVKVPYRNLTSQIVSKEEIQKEIVERGRKKQAAAMAGGDVMFARKLTQRLAKKLAPEEITLENKKVADTEEVQEKKTVIPKQADGDPLGSTKETEGSSKIQDNSDLLAILEGDGEEMPVLPKETSADPDDSNIKLMEREIALQQLHDLPYLSPKQRAYRGRHCKETKAPMLAPEVTTPKPVSVKAVKSPSTAPGKSPKKVPIEIEPQIKVNMALKTYSRKRKTSEVPEVTAEVKKPVVATVTTTEVKPKIELPTQPDVYMTKSSRIIKKKVIWDPDDDFPRSPRPLKVEISSSSLKTTPPKQLKTVEKPPENQKPIEKKPPVEKQTKPMDKKPEEKPQTKKPSETIEKKPTALQKTTTPKSKKPRSEIDKLLGDEGAIKMLYELKNNDETEPRKKKNVISVDKTYKELMKKANEIKNELESSTSNESPKSLRKKETISPVVAAAKTAPIAASVSRQKSKDSVRSSGLTPPGSPAFSYTNSENTYLIRRRSSSSISSTEDLNDTEERATAKRKSVSSTELSSKPKKQKKTSETTDKDKEETNEKPEEVTISEKTQSKLGQYKNFTVKKTGKHVTVDLMYPDSECYCTSEVLDELTAVLNKLGKEKDCNVVLLSSARKSFSLGLDYRTLVSEKESERKHYATDLAEKVTDFLLCLLHFPKVLIAGIQGECVGLFVTMLPLFDIVVASDVATFSATFSALGSIAEAGFLLTLPHLTNHGLAAELLYTQQKLTADDAFRRGLISKLCWPEKYNDTLKNLLVSVAKGSRQSLESTKKQLRSHILESTEAAIRSQTKQLVEHWTSNECQKNFAKLAATS